MNKYEILYILSGALDEVSKEAEIEKVSAMVGEVGGTVESVNKWGLKKFAYPINYKKEGHYVLMNFTSPAEAPKEIDRRLKIADNVVRFMILRK